MAGRRRSPRFSKNKNTPGTSKPSAQEQPPTPDIPTEPADPESPESTSTEPVASSAPVELDVVVSEVAGNGKSNGNGSGEHTAVATMPAPDAEPADDDSGDRTAGDDPDPEADEADDDSSDAAEEDGSAHSPGSVRRARQRAIRTALATLPVPDPEPGFWAGLDVSLAEQKPLAIMARPAIRPISEPPPLSQPKPGDSSADTELRLKPRSSSRDARDFRVDGSGRWKLVAAIVGLVVLLLVVGSSLADDGTAPPETTTTTSTLPGEVTTQPARNTTPSTVQIRGLGPTTTMTPAGVGPVLIGSRLADLDSQSIERTVDQATFDGSGGTCFDVHLPAMLDLTLRYRSPNPAQGVGDPAEAVLASVSVSRDAGSQRGTEVAMGLLAPEEAVRDAHAGNLDVIDDPYLPGGEIYLVPASDGSGNGLAYVTDGSVITEIHVGALDVISSRQPCI